MSSELCPSMNARRPLITTDYEAEALSIFGNGGANQESIWLDINFNHTMWEIQGIPVKYQPMGTGKCVAFNFSSKSVDAYPSCDLKMKSVCQSNGCKYYYCFILFCFDLIFSDRPRFVYIFVYHFFFIVLIDSGQYQLV